MLNGTLCATERAMCCLVENYQTPEVLHSCFVADNTSLLIKRGVMQGLIVPEVLRPYMQGRDFISFVKELPKGLQKKQA